MQGPTQVGPFRLGQSKQGCRLTWRAMGYYSYEMADIYSRKLRSALIAMVCGKGKQTNEGKLLRSEGYAGWRRQQRISGQDAKDGPFRMRPDFIFRSRRIAI